jgi:hypothetical protein
LRHDKSSSFRISSSSFFSSHVVDPHVSHFMQVPLRTMVKLPHSPQASPSSLLARASAQRTASSSRASALPPSPRRPPRRPFCRRPGAQARDLLADRGPLGFVFRHGLDAVARLDFLALEFGLGLGLRVL